MASHSAPVANRVRMKNPAMSTMSASSTSANQGDVGTSAKCSAAKITLDTSAARCSGQPSANVCNAYPRKASSCTKALVAYMNRPAVSRTSTAAGPRSASSVPVTRAQPSAHAVANTTSIDTAPVVSPAAACRHRQVETPIGRHGRRST